MRGEYCPYGSLLLDGKKVGSFGYDTWGGDMKFDVDEKHYAEFCKRVDEYFNKYPILNFGNQLRGFDIFIEELVNLCDLEKQFLSHLKKLHKKYGDQIVDSEWRALSLVFNSKTSLAQHRVFFAPSDAMVKKVLSEHKPDTCFILTKDDFSIK